MRDEIKLDKQPEYKKTDFFSGESSIGYLESRLEGAEYLLRGLENGLHQVMDKCIQTVDSMNIPAMKNVRILRTPRDLIASFFIRGYVYELSGYDSEFGNQGLDFDKYDEHSVSFGYELGGCLVASLRLVLDGAHGLPSEKYCPEISDLRFCESFLAEGSRTVILPEFRKKSGILVQLLMASKRFAQMNDVSRIVFCSERQVFSMYNKSFAPQRVHNENVVYGAVESPLILSSFNPKDSYESFEKMFERYEGKDLK